MKKAIFIGLLIVILLSPFLNAWAQDWQTCPKCNPDQKGGIVPCSRSCDDASTTVHECAPCSLCHFFILIMMIVNFVLFKLTAPLALLMLIIGGAMFMLAAGNPNTITRARKLIGAVLIGIVIIYSSYFLVGLFLQSVGLADWTKGIYQSWWNTGGFTIECEVPET